jgi:hypothetical protein
MTKEVECDLGLEGREGRMGRQRREEEHCGWEEQNEWGLKSGGELA